MRPAVWPRGSADAERLLVASPDGTRIDATVGELPSFLEPGDLLVVNDAATLPASLHGTTERGERFEARLAGLDGARARAVVFGDGSWRTPTEKRAAPPLIRAGERVSFGETLSACVESSVQRAIDIEFEQSGAALYQGLYRAGRPVQYSYVAGDFELWHVQSRFASRPWAVEMPSAGRPLTWSTLFELRRRGVLIASLTHAAGLSSTGSDVLDQALPGPERYEIPERTLALVRSRRQGEGRVIAVGTTVVRALESSAAAGWAPAGTATLVLSAAHRLRAVDGIFTGMHEPGTSHFELLAAFAPKEALSALAEHAERAGYLGHELGDSCLILPARELRRQAA